MTATEIALLALVFVLLCVAPTVFGSIGTINEDGTGTIHLSAEEVRKCIAEGGCIVATDEGLKQYAKESCGVSI